ncbi:MAG: sialate O-acetylesterase [Acidobacteria bacterium]|nr:sialate O-acetylesterase [Acidobacteriota bacterium]
MFIRFAAGVALLAAVAMAEVKLPAIVSDHMLLQAGVPARIFGKAEPGESVTVQFHGQTHNATTAADGRWHVWLQPLKAGDAGDMTIAGKNTITVRDVLAGEVWVGSGQSNMQWAVRQTNNADAEARNANYPRIRLFYVPRKTTPEPQDDVEAKWELCSPETAPAFSAVMYYFGRDMHKKMNVPFGLIHTSWGGTPAQAWTSREALGRDAALSPILGEWAKVLDAYPDAFARFSKQMAEYEAAVKTGNTSARRPAMPVGMGHAHTPSGLFNAMINPILPYTIKGALWYQGESNASRVQAPLYQRLFETMIQDWRDRWELGDFPFLWVQLANFAKAGSPGDWVIVQEAQAKTMRLKKTGMAVINDIGEPNDIHPKNKQDVGARLALAARHIAYGEAIAWSGPRFRQATAEAPTTGDRGGKMRVWFDSVGGGLKARGGSSALQGFEVAGADQRFYPADARIDGETVVVSSPSVMAPVAVRYAWESNPVNANLVNAEGLPTSAFRSKAW